MNRPVSAANEIAIVGYGALLPEADTAEEFWANLMASRCSIREIPDAVWPKQLYWSGDTSVPDKSASFFAGYVDQTAIQRAADDLGINFNKYNRLQIMALAAAEQALRSLPPGKVAPNRTAIYLGCMSVDADLSPRKFIADEWDSLKIHAIRHCGDEADTIMAALWKRIGRWAVDSERDRPYLITSAVLNLLQQRFDLQGESALVDAACASSLAAIDLAMHALRAGQADRVLTGGVDANLGPSSFVLFSQLGALAKTRCLPLDRRSEGLSQGEGAVCFVLERLSDALRLGHPIHGILKGCGVSSDGHSSSLFALTIDGQLRAYAQAYADLDPYRVDYLECHGTGTPVGDETEMQSLQRYFGNRRFPIGSVKALIGHTKATAGAVSLLKCLLCLKHRTIPPSSYFQQAVLGEGKGPYVNSRSVSLRRRGTPLTMATSSFGFGGINYHLVLQEPDKHRVVRQAVPARLEAAREIVVIGQAEQPTAGVRQAHALASLRIPQRSLDQIDAVQVAALLATLAAAKTCHIDFSRLDRRVISVISASTLGLDAAYSVSNRVLHFDLEPALSRWHGAAAKVMAHKQHLPPITEDSGPGSLNNVIAGRVANHFDLTGPSFNIDADLASFPAALHMAKLRLATQDGLVVLLAVDERYDSERFHVVRNSVTCWLFASLSFAKSYNLPIAAQLGHLAHAAYGGPA